MLNRSPEFTSVGLEELLTQILRSQSKAKTICENFAAHELADAHQRELGLSDAAYKRLMVALEIGRRVVGEREPQKITKISKSADAIAFCRNHFANLVREGLKEEMHVVTLDTKNVVINTHQISVGTLDASLVHPREVFRVAIKDASSSIIVAHNHPSGSPEPSKEDFAVTRRLEDAGKVIGIDMLDHIVMGRMGCVSIMERR